MTPGPAPDTVAPDLAEPAAWAPLVGWLAARSGPRSAFAVSIDRLDAVNEVLGLQAGAAVGRAAADRVRRWCGPAGCSVRLGPAEHLVVRADLAGQPAALAAAGELRRVLADPVGVAGLPVTRSASIGVCVDPDGSRSAADLVRDARRAGTVARAAGGDTVRSHDPEAAAGRLARTRLELELPDAVATR